MQKIGGVLEDMENAAMQYDASRVVVHLLRAIVGGLNGRRSAESVTPHLHVLSSRISRGSQPMRKSSMNKWTEREHGRA